MLHIILLILKITGILLLCILGILLLAFCCVLFVPLRYRIEVLREEGEGKPPFSVRIRITWLLHLINVFLCYPAEVYVRARIFLFTVFRIPEKEKKGKKTGKQKDKDDRTDGGREGTAGPEGAQTGGKDEDAGNAERDALAATKTEGDRQTTPAGPEAAEDAAAVEAQADGAAQSREPSGLIGRWIGKLRELIDKLREIFRKIRTAVENIQYTIRHFCDKIKSALDNIQYYREVVESEAFHHSWLLCRKQAGALLREIKPDRFEAELVIGTEDPAVTGEFLAVCGMLYTFMGQNVRIVGDFERAHVEGYVYMKGAVHVFPFLCAAVKVYWNKDIRTLIKLFKKEAV